MIKLLLFLKLKAFLYKTILQRETLRNTIIKLKIIKFSILSIGDYSHSRMRELLYSKISKRPIIKL